MDVSPESAELSNAVRALGPTSVRAPSSSRYGAEKREVLVEYIQGRVFADV